MANPSEADVITARTACVRCRGRKRKCNKDLRGCSTCTRLGARCSYTQPSGPPFAACAQRSHNLVSLTTSYHLPDGRGVSVSCLSHGSPALYQGDSFFAEAFKLAGSLKDIELQASKYFASIHIWLPVVSRRRFSNTIRNLPDDLSRRTAWTLLACTIRLITYVPQEPAHPGCGDIQVILYKAVKRLLLLSELECKPSLDLVQAMLLMSAYEIGHGLESAAYLTIGSCARLAILLGLDRRSVEPAMASPEEISRTWWGIVIVERYINLTFPQRPLITSDPDPSINLPADDDAWDTESNERLAPVPMTISSDIPAGPFAREAQAATLLGRTLTHIATPTSDVEFNMAECRQLDRTLTSFLTVLPVEDMLKPCSAYCGAMGICISALLLLHTYELNLQNTSSCRAAFPSSQEALDLCRDFVVMRATKYTSELATVDLDSLSPFAPHAIYQGAILQCRFLTQNRNHQQRAAIRRQLDMLEKMLASFGRRWHAAEQMCQQLRIAGRSG